MVEDPYICIYVCRYMYILPSSYMYILYVCMYVCMCVCMFFLPDLTCIFCVYVYNILMYVCMYVCFSFILHVYFV